MKQAILPSKQKPQIVNSPNGGEKPVLQDHTAPDANLKTLKTQEQSQKEIDEQIAKIKFPLKTTALTSAVPLGLAYYSYYNNFSLTKGIGVVVIGSVVAFYGAIMLSGKKFV
jgi:hypothetical protein